MWCITHTFFPRNIFANTLVTYYKYVSIQPFDPEHQNSEQKIQGAQQIQVVCFLE